jgi:hypothetical protein
MSHEETGSDETSGTGDHAKIPPPAVTGSSGVHNKSSGTDPATNDAPSEQSTQPTWSSIYGSVADVLKRFYPNPSI